MIDNVDKTYYAKFKIIHNSKLFFLTENKLAKARKMRKPPGKLSLKKFGPGKIWVENFRLKILAYFHTNFRKSYQDPKYL